MKTPHTPTPWQAHKTNFFGVRKERQYIAITNSNVSICKMTASEGMELSEVPDAAYIVRACNSHDYLVAALKKMLSEHDCISQQDGKDRWPGTANQARAAIAKATGGNHD